MDIFPFGAPARNHPLVPGSITNRDKRRPFCHGSLQEPGLMVCLYIKAATLSLQHFFVPDPPPSSSSCPPLPPPSSSQTAAFRGAPWPLPPGFSATASLPESAVHRPANALDLRHATGPPPSAPGTRPAFTLTCPGLRGSHPHTPRISLLLILLLRVVLPVLRGSTAVRRVPCRPPACASSPPPVHQHLCLILLPLPSASRLSFPTTVGAHPPTPLCRRRTPTLPDCPQIRSC
jgi:hypothetical protein